jgi:hypothetical protein
LFLRCKSNIGADSDGFEFNLEQQALEGCEDMFASVATLGQALQGNTRTILTDAETEPGDGDGGAFDEAKEWLLDFLVGGPHAVKEVFKAVGEAGRAQKILRRAKSSLGVLARKSSLRGGWERFYPGAMNEGGQGGQENPKMPTLCGGAPWENLATFGPRTGSQRSRYERGGDPAHRLGGWDIGLSDWFGYAESERAHEDNRAPRPGFANPQGRDPGITSGKDRG